MMRCLIKHRVNFILFKFNLAFMVEQDGYVLANIKRIVRIFTSKKFFILAVCILFSALNQLGCSLS
jgi:hypothetical protein